VDLSERTAPLPTVTPLDCIILAFANANAKGGGRHNWGDEGVFLRGKHRQSGPSDAAKSYKYYTVMISAMECPGCGKTFLHPVTTDGVKVDACYDCTGMWTSRTDLNKLVVGEIRLGKPKGTNDRSCPRDGERLDRVFLSGEEVERKDVELDQCAACEGIWFDGGELEAVGDIQSRLKEKTEGRAEGWSLRDRRMRILSQIYGIDKPLSTRPQRVSSQFIARVYRLLALGIVLMGLGMVGWGLMVLSPDRSIRIFAWVFYVIAFITEIVIIIIISMMRRKRQSQIGLYLIFTTLMGVTAGPLPVFLVARGQLSLVLSVFVLTAGIFVILSIIVHSTKANLEHWGRHLLPMLGLLIFMEIILIILSFTGVLPGSSTTWLILGISILGATLFCGFILYDTSRLLHKAEPGDEVLMAMELFLDFVNLFIELLRIAAILSEVLET